MAAYTINDNDSGRGVRFLESTTATNSAVAKTKVVKVPGWAKFLTAYLFVDSQGGTTPQLDLTLFVPDFGSAALMAAPSDANPANLISITQVTGVGPYQQVIDLGPGVTGIADDTTGAAAADAREAMNCVLPPWIGYALTTTATDGDEDATVRLVFHFRGEGR